MKMTKLTRRLKAAIRDERMAPKDYIKLRKSLSSPMDRRIVTGIIKQERNHFRKLKKMLRRVK